MRAATALGAALAGLLLLTTGWAEAQQTGVDTGQTVDIGGQTFSIDELTDEQLRQVLVLLLQEQQQMAEQIAELQQRLGEARPEAQPETEEGPTLEELLDPPELETSDSVRSAVTPGASSFNPDVAVVGDFLLNLGDLPDSLGFHRYNMNNRHVELAFSQRVAPVARGVVKFAWEGAHAHIHERPTDEPENHEQQEAEHLTLEEAYLQFDQLIDNAQIRLGRERVPFMTYNLLGAHELPFADRPLAIARTLGGDGLVEDGVRLSYLLPTRSYLDLDLAAYGCRNEIAFDAGTTNRPLWFARLHGYSSWDDTRQELDYSLGWLEGPHDEESHDADVWGLQLHYQALPTLFDRTIAEAGYVRSHVEGDPASRTADGYYLHLAKRWDRYRRQQLGLRWDSSQSIFPGLDRDIDMISAYYTWHKTERIRLRGQYSHAFIGGEPDADTVLLQATYVMGTHPAHD